MDPNDKNVDLAIEPIWPDFSKVAAKTVPTELFVTKEMIEKERVNDTDEIVFAGLFAPYQGVRRNFPIVRHGKLAMISDEPIPWSDGVTEDLYLADLMSFGGNSCSPVFLRLGGVSETGAISGYRYVLLGVMQGITRPNHR